MSVNSELLQNVITQSRLTEKSCFSEKVYRDEPILMTASQMANYTPPIYKKMREIAHSNPLATEAYIFYKQASFMEHHTDTFEQEVSFLRYYPTYHMMSDVQLRAYFSWRTKIRQGMIQKTNLSFAYIYMYELLNGIGTQSYEDGFLQLLEFRDAYLPLDTHVGVYLNRWLKDYCIYYNLSQQFLSRIPDFSESDAASVLVNCENETDTDVFAALMQISDYNFETSRFYKKYPTDCCAVAAEVARELNRHFRNSGRYSTREYFFGTFNDGKRSLFSGAVFYERPKEDGYSYKLSKTEEYEYRNHQWHFHKFMLFSGKTQRAGSLLRTIDSRMRTAYKFRNALKEGIIPEKWEEIVDSCIENYLIKKRFEAAVKIEIDLSCLQSIRADALDTQQRLLIVQEDEPALQTEQMPEQSEAVMNCDNTNNTMLSDLHYTFLCSILNGKDYKELLQKNNTTTAIVCDEINAQLFEEFCDTVIDFNCETPLIIEDYINDLKGYLGI